ncbi:hypothetical protein F511_34815 [Dorcoceras hygrometricum]|uniref:Protein kinase domain-containing protein n=1 Tax=Dorcoceras hygrometricum TaxID=472368 RepID=A0A2Z7D7X5_9LAMI|nr:hypothetical protein F511_34815 [Dorcoceras hygrometricum]
MAISHNTFLSISSLFLAFAASLVSAQLPNNTANTDFTWSTGSPRSCATYVTYRVQAPYSDLVSISKLFRVSSLDIAKASSLPSDDSILIPDQLLLIPIKCTCNGTYYFSNVTYTIKNGDNFYSVSIKPFQNLTNYQFVEDMNPTLKPNNLTIGAEAVFPLLCKCPRKSYLDKETRHLITYVWQPGDDVFSVSTMFQASASDIVMENNNRNFTRATFLPLLIPIKSSTKLPMFHAPETHVNSKHHLIFVTILSLVMALVIILSGFAAYFKLLYKKNKMLVRNDSSLETCDLVPACKASKDETSFPKTTPDKLLPGLSDYLGKPIMYDLHVILKAAMNFSAHNRIGGSVYKAIINDQVFAVKKTRDAAEELKILQKVNHVNLVKLMGVSSDNDGNFYIVYEYVENGSLEKWLFPKVSSSSDKVEPLSWRQRLLIALEVANGLQYLQEHTQPSVVHKDITTSNILLDSNFKPKISNFSAARATKCSIILKVDVFSFGIVLLELLSGKKVMEMKDNGEVVMLWKEIKGILEVEDQRKERLRRWMDPKMKGCFDIEDALSLANLARACTSEKSSDRPRMSEIVFNLCVVTESSPHMYENSGISNLEVMGVYPVIRPIMAR